MSCKISGNSIDSFFTVILFFSSLGVALPSFFSAIIHVVSKFREFRKMDAILLEFDKTKLSETSQNCYSWITLLTEILKMPKNLFGTHRSTEIRTFKVVKIFNKIWFLASEF